MGESKTVRVLVADDDVTSRMLMQVALEADDFEVELACDGNDALGKFKEGVFDIVLLDVEMPGMDGFTVCESIRKDFDRNVPIVMVTGLGDVASIEHAFGVGATDFIAKPINWTLIGYRMKYVLRSYRNLQALAVAEEQNMAMLRALPDTLLKIDVEGRLLSAYGQIDLFQGLSYGMSLSEVLSKDVSKQLNSVVSRALISDHAHDLDFMIEDESRRIRYFEGKVTRSGSGEVLCILRDVTGRHEIEQRIEYLSSFDALTGLPNRTSFAAQVEKQISRAHRHGERFAILFMGLDGFKEINDAYGHAAGDELLRWVASELKRNVRASDFLGRSGTENIKDENRNEEKIVARFGGDEFTVLLPDINRPEDALAIAQRIQKTLRTPEKTIARSEEGGGPQALTTTIGIVMFPEDAGDVQDLLKFADTAMHAAKEKGRESCCFYNPALTDRVSQRLSMESGLRAAMDHNEFVVFYQPQVDARNRSIRSVEALVRWNHPERGIVGPVEFISIAEEIDLIQCLGEFVLRTACRDIARWDRLGMPRLRVAVNLSPIQLHSSSLKDVVKRTLDEFLLTPDRLELEVTESVFLEDSEQSMSILNDLRAMGIQIAIDDFGTGFSSLGYLKKLPVTNLKIDRSFVKDLPASPGDEAIIKAIVTLSQNLGMQVTAEGVETQVQANTLRDLGCEFLQGYFFGKPQPFEGIASLFLVKSVAEN